MAKKRGGQTGGHNAIVRRQTGNMFGSAIHEVGHNFGMSHGYGVMKEDSSGDGITRSSIAESLGRVGIGTKVDYFDNKGGMARSSFHSQGTAPNNFSQGSVMTREQFDRDLNKAIRKNSKE